MMRKLLTIIALMYISLSAVHAQDHGQKGSARFRFGIEWGYSLSLLNSYQYDYIDPSEGFRVDKSGTKLQGSSNALIATSVGVEFARHFGASLNAGYAGISQARRIFPLSLRETVYFKSYDQDGILAYIEEGLGFHAKDMAHPTYLAKTGTGYRFVLTPRSCMDFILSFQLSTDHPPIYDSHTMSYISKDNLRRSDALYTGINITVAITL